MKELVDDVRQTISALGSDKVTVVGHDWGGFIAGETAIRHPELLDRLVIINTAHTGIIDRELRKGGAQAAVSKYMLTFRSSRGEELVSRGDFAGFRREIIGSRLASETMSEQEAAEYFALQRRLDAGGCSGPDSSPHPVHVIEVDVIDRTALPSAMTTAELRTGSGRTSNGCFRVCRLDLCLV